MARHRIDDAAGDDPFGTAALRAAVLDSWRRSPARFREDANAEESLALVGYAGRVLVELVANAADAAAAAGVAGRILVEVVDDELRVANTGAPLTADGVAALASLRASAKRDDTAGVGRFGVGFSAVRAVSDRPAVVSRTGSVQFDAIRTVDAVRDLGVAALTDELRRRSGDVPVLRLPWPLPDTIPPDGYDTQVRLPLRPGIDPADLLAAAGDHLLLAMPAIGELALPGRVFRRQPDGDLGVVAIGDGDVVTRWRLSERSGEWPPELLADLPVEQRARSGWRLSWAQPLGRPLGPDVLYAPTPTDDALDLPARLIGTFPVDDTRRHLAPGRAGRLLLDEAVPAYLELLLSASDEHRWDLLPDRGFGRSTVDNQLRLGIWAAVRETPVLLTAAGDAVRAELAVVLPNAPDELILMVAQAIPGLLPAPRSAVERDAWRALGVASIGYPELSAALSALDRPPAFWNALYALLDPGFGESLGDLPVPLAAGRTVLGARGCLLVGPSDDWAAGLVRLEPRLRVVHADAVASAGARELLVRIGARPAEPTALLGEPAVLEMVSDLRERWERGSSDPDEVEAVAEAILDAVAAGGEPPAALVAELLMTDRTGQPWPAAELLLPGSALAGLVDADNDLAVLGRRWLQRYPRAVLGRAGALDGFRVVVDAAPEGPDHGLADEEEYWAEIVADRVAPTEFVAIADLELVADDRWTGALALIERDPAARAALTAATDGLPNYTGWWLSRFALLDGHPPGYWRQPDAVDLTGLYDPLPVLLADDVAAAVGVRLSLAQVLADDPRDVLARFADPGRRIPRVLVPTVTARLADAILRAEVDALPDGVRSLAGCVCLAAEAMVLDLPWLAQVVEPGWLVAGGRDPERVAEAFDLDLASERLRYTLIEGPELDGGAPDGLEATLADLGLAGLADDWPDVRWRPGLSVTTGHDRYRVAWWRSDDVWWVDGSPAGWGRLVAQLADSWPLRHAATALFAGRAGEVAEDGIG